jgi:hypothetical protein
MQRAHGPHLREISKEHVRRTARIADLAGDGLGFLAAAVGVNGNAVAVGGEIQRDCLADAARCAGHKNCAIRRCHAGVPVHAGVAESQAFRFRIPR